MESLATLAIIAVLTASAIAQMPSTRVMPAEFRSDGCSMFPDGNYRACCVVHDEAYYFGGTNAQRKAADQELFECVRGKGHKYLSKMMWLGVRIGGVSFLPTPFRWGFGNNWPRKAPPK